MLLFVGCKLRDTGPTEATLMSRWLVYNVSALGNIGEWGLGVLSTLYTLQVSTLCDIQLIYIIQGSQEKGYLGNSKV